jgi:hypothetical protein
MSVDHRIHSPAYLQASPSPTAWAGIRRRGWRALVTALPVLLLAHGSGLRAEDTIEIAVKDKQFQPSELSVPANTAFVLKVKNLGGKAIEFESKSMKVEKVIAANSEATIRVRPLAPGRYGFFDEFNPDTKGTLVAQ